MKISIEYEASWRNSFLEGNNNEPLPKQTNGVYRKFVASMTNLGKSENYLRREVTLDTVMGILNRLIGDQRKLYQSRNIKNYYFSDLESKVHFLDRPTIINNEMTYIRNISGSTDQNSFSGAIKSNDPMLQSDFSKELWGVLSLTIGEVCQFICDEKYIIDNDVSLNPIDLAYKAENLQGMKAIENIDLYKTTVDRLNVLFVSDALPTPFVEKNGKIQPIRIYAAALYLQLGRLGSKYDMANAVTKAGKIAGFSWRGFNGKRDFMKNFSTGGEKKIWGNPYIYEEFVKGEGKIQRLMTKASGQLEITIDVDRQKAQEIKDLIENAGVSAFYLGKKGLAYVSDIRL